MKFQKSKNLKEVQPKSEGKETNKETYSVTDQDWKQTQKQLLFYSLMKYKKSSLLHTYDLGWHRVQK